MMFTYTVCVDMLFESFRTEVSNKHRMQNRLQRFARLLKQSWFALSFNRIQLLEGKST